MCNFRALESEYEVDALFQTLKEVPMIPLANGSVVSLSSEGVFFPLSDVTQANTGTFIKYIISVYLVLPLKRLKSVKKKYYY